MPERPKRLGVCLKELRESQCWLQLIVRADLLPAARLTPLLDESDQLIAILVKSIATAKTRKQELGTRPRADA